jgi:outer membrane protein
MRACWLTIVVLLVLVADAVGLAEAVEPSIAYVDMERLLQRAPQIVEGRRRLDEAFRLRNETIEQQRQRLGELEAQRRQEGDLMSLDQLESLSARMDALEAEIERSSMALQDEFSIRLNEEMVDVQEQMNAVIRELARERSLDLVVANPVLYASERIDLTDVVLQRLEESYRERQSTIN